ncbi:hypothetical protein [Persicitalea sp.]|uniref:hypothetical protein n=1 Tax=Persicitalea sp. TaxID=3100273 RepID=UPI0035933771
MKSTKQSPLKNLKTKCPQLQQILDRYGQDALHPQILTTPTEEGIDIELVPKMRFDMACKDWFALCPDFRLFVSKVFYESL